MNSFREAYKKAADSIAQPHIDALSVLDVRRRKKATKRRRIQYGMTVASVVIMIGIGGFTTAKAAGYLGGIIRVSEHGFVSGDVDTMTQSQVIDEVVVSHSDEAASEERAYNSEVAMCDVEEMLMSTEEILEQHFTSREAFEAAELGLRMSFPDEKLLEAGEEIATEINVFGDMIFVRMTAEEGRFVDLQRYDYGEKTTYASSTVYPGEICNERTFTTEQGFMYTLIDIVPNEEEGLLSIRAAITIDGYELYVGFYGYEEEQAERILDSIDLTVYCRSE